MDWLEVEDEVGEITWRVDAAFLNSNWMCIWDKGCAGIEREADVDRQLGCCSVGAQMLDEQEAMLISALAATLGPDRAQFAAEISASGALSDDAQNTRLVEGACILLNRPGFPGGAGCALHGEAIANGESPIDWKPSVCWQLPLKVERTKSGDGSDLATLRGWQRGDWGPDGEAMAYCCTEPATSATYAADAYVSETPVHVSLRAELSALMGADVVDRLTAQLATKKRET